MFAMVQHVVEIPPVLHTSLFTRDGKQCGICGGFLKVVQTAPIAVFCLINLHVEFVVTERRIHGAGLNCL